MPAISAFDSFVPDYSWQAGNAYNSKRDNPAATKPDLRSVLSSKSAPRTTWVIPANNHRPRQPIGN